MTITADSHVGAVAAEHPLATRVFARHGIDFCCGGGRPLSEACEAHGVALEPLLAEIGREIESAPQSEVRWDDAPFADLIDHILQTFHAPLREELPRLEQMARKVNTVHGEKDPQRLAAVLDTIVALRAELEQHLLKEEQILFPMILQGQGAMAMGPVSVMEAEHEDAGRALRRLRDLTDGYQPPEGACNTWRALWAGFADLEAQTHQHIHLENNILFPRALKS